MADENSGPPTTDLEALMDVSVDVTAVLGTTQMAISQVLKLGRGAVVELDRHVGEDVEVYANNRVVARAEVVVVEDRLGVTITDVLMAHGGAKR